jgi:peptidylamidoglycolate lyase
MKTLTRRRWMQTTASTALGFPFIQAQSPEILGQGTFRYRLVPGWGVLDSKTPVKNGHGLVVDSAGHVIFLTDHPANQVLIYDRNGRLVHKWGTEFPGAHGLSIVREGQREVLFLTCLQTHRVVKATLDGEILQEWHWPEAIGKYENETQFKPSWTLHLPNGHFFVLDGYGRDYILHHDEAGHLVKCFGGSEGGITHWGPHGGLADTRDPARPELLIAMSDQQHLLRLDLNGGKLGKIDLPGGNPRQVRLHEGHFFVAHLADNWPADRQSRGFVSVLDSELRVVANLGGSAPEYDGSGVLRHMHNTSPIFLHPHDLALDADGSLYVAQFASGNTYPLKFERV